MEPFSAVDRDPSPAGPERRLTFNPADDRTPEWSAGGDSIYYSAASFDAFTEHDGVLATIAARGGAARPLLENAQLPSGAPLYLLAPAPAPSAEKLVYAEVGEFWPSNACPNTIISCDPAADPSLPPLKEFVLHVRPSDAFGPIEEDQGLRVTVPGVDLDPVPTNSPQQHVVHNYPFHQLFERERAALFRASWAPDGRRLVYSNGAQLFIWDLQAEATPIPNSEFGVGPAWSPDGAWIAFSRLESADSTNATCIYVPEPPPVPFVPTCVQERTDYLPGRRLLTLLRPDGSEVRQLGEGEEPAWSPDSRSIFYRNGDMIWQVGVDGSGTASVPFTDRGREPAVSPDGTRLAFARLSRAGDHDIWIVTFALLP